MATSTWIPLGQTTLSSSDGAVVFSNIPNSYTELIAIAEIKSATAGAHGGRIRLNGDSGSNYNYQYLAGTGSGSGISYSGTTTGEPSWGFSDTEWAQVICHVYDYSKASSRKVMQTHYGRGTSAAGISTTIWTGTAVVNQFEFNGQGAFFAAGSRFQLYGIAG